LYRTRARVSCSPDVDSSHDLGPGIRGIVGESLTPPVIARFAAAFASSLGAGPVVVAATRAAPARWSPRDRSRPHRRRPRGRRRGLATTPTTAVAVEHLKARAA